MKQLPNNIKNLILNLSNNNLSKNTSNLKLLAEGLK